VKIVSKGFEKVMRHGAVRYDLLDLDSNSLCFEHADDNGKSSVSFRFAQYKRKGTSLGLTGG
jgi:hypothetical protein